MIIATRHLAIIEPNGTTDVPVRIFAPEERGGAWFCPYEIGWPDETWKSAAGGWDSMQSLVHALQKISIELYTSEYHQAGTLAWDKPGDGYGFPMKWSGRDLLVGDDRFL